MTRRNTVQETGSVNGYQCVQTGVVTWVRHIDPGVTPFQIRCRAASCGCGGKAEATSLFYPTQLPPDVAGAWEWWRPRTEADARLAAAAMIGDAIERLDKFPIDPQAREDAIVGLVRHWRDGGALLRKSSEPWTVKP